MSTAEQKAKEKKEHPIIVNVTGTVISGTIMLFVVTLYNLFLAHIWPVTIHFGDYSLANAIYILVSVLSSLVIAFLAFYVAIFYFLNLIFRGLLGFLLPAEQRAKKRTWLGYTINGLGFFFMLPLYGITKWQQWRNPPVRSESAQRLMDKLHQAQSNNEENQ